MNSAIIFANGVASGFNIAVFVITHSVGNLIAAFISLGFAVWLTKRTE